MLTRYSPIEKEGKDQSTKKCMKEKGGQSKSKTRNPYALSTIYSKAAKARFRERCLRSSEIR